jgi:hypothetical protein
MSPYILSALQAALSIKLIVSMDLFFSRSVKISDLAAMKNRDN